MKQRIKIILILLLVSITLSACQKNATFTLDKQEINLEIGQTEMLNLTFSPSEGKKPELLWVSSEEKIASVDNTGKVEGVAPGKTQITVKTTDGKQTAVCSITVNPKAVKGIKLNKESLNLVAVSNEKLEFAIDPIDAGNQRVKWSSSDPKVAEVDDQGNIKAIAEGKAEIKAVTEDGGFSALCLVAVTAPKQTESNTAGSTRAASPPNVSGSTGSPSSNNIDPGNVQSNQINLGLVAESGGWIYYTGVEHGGLLYKMKADGSQASLVLNSSAARISIVGSKLYFSLTSFPPTGSSEGTYYLPLNGGNNYYLVSRPEFNYVYVEANVVYYGHAGGLFKDGNGFLAGVTILNGGTNFHIISGSVYYIKSMDSKIYKMGLDGLSGTLIVDAEVSRFSISGNKLYYISSKDKRIYSTGLDGSAKLALTSEPASTVNVHNGWIYYTNENDGNRIYKIKIDGSGRTKLSEKPASAINLVGDWIFFSGAYSAVDLDRSIYMMKTNGSDLCKI